MTTAHDNHIPTLRPFHNGPLGRGRRPTPTLHDRLRIPAAEFSGHVSKPYCESCGTDEFIYLESFTPPVIRRDGTIKVLGEVSYTCNQCEEFSGHKVPFTWAPSGWFLG